MSLEYLESLHQRHEDWLVDKKSNLKISERIQDLPVLVLDCDEEFVDNKEKRSQMLNDIRNFVMKL